MFKQKTQQTLFDCFKKVTSQETAAVELDAESESSSSKCESKDE